MERYYPFITMVSMALFGWVGWRMAISRNRNPAVWTALGAIFPPLLLILLVLKSREDDADAADTEAADDV